MRLKNGIAIGGLIAAALMPLHASAQISGFATNYTLNNGATVDGTGTVLTLTDNAGNEARSAFFNTKQNINAFTAQFTYQAGGAKSADGVTFTLQNVAPTAVGSLGGGLGYSGITTSVAYEMNIYSPNGVGTIVHVNGATGGYLSNTPLNIASGDSIAVNLQYAAGSLLETLTDTTASTTYTHTYVIDIPATVGGSTAYVGFTGGTGGATSTQTISKYTFTPTVANTPEPGSLALLTGLGVSGSFFAWRRRSRK